MTDTTLKSATRPPGWARIGLVIYGVLLVLFGLGAVLLPMLATYAASAGFGGLLFVSGIVGFISLVADWRSKGFIWRLLWALVATLGGLCIFFHPWAGAVALTLVLGASLILQGLIGVGHAVSHRDTAKYPWVWTAVGGVLTAVLGGLLVWMLPHAGMIIPGLFLAINLLSFGFSMIAIGLAGREPDRDAR
jgi:uncharacterized membrane protein HdeD (DUF308 family)